MVRMAAVAIWVLAKPVLAEAALRYAAHQWNAGRGDDAAWWFEAGAASGARRLALSLVRRPILVRAGPGECECRGGADGR
jgi:hypothetical protein